MFDNMPLANVAEYWKAHYTKNGSFSLGFLQ